MICQYDNLCGRDVSNPDECSAVRRPVDVDCRAGGMRTFEFVRCRCLCRVEDDRHGAVLSQIQTRINDNIGTAFFGGVGIEHAKQFLVGEYARPCNYFA